MLHVLSLYQSHLLKYSYDEDTGTQRLGDLTVRHMCILFSILFLVQHLFSFYFHEPVRTSDQRPSKLINTFNL